MAAVTSPTIRIGTWNVQEGRIDGRDVMHAEDVTALHAAVEEVRGAHVLALQEVPFNADGRSPFLDMISAGSSLEHVYTETLSPSMFDADRESGLAILSTIPMRPIHFATLPNPELTHDWGAEYKRTFDKGMIAVTLDWYGADVTVGSVHSFPFHRFGRTANDPEFEHIWEVLAGQIEELPHQQLAVCGDFNTEIRELVLSRLRRPLDRTFPGMVTSRKLQIDDILHSPTLTLDSMPRTVPTFSDHKLCVADFKFAERGDGNAAGRT